MNHEQLLAIRQSLGLTQKDFASRLGILPNHYAKLERGERDISQTICILALILEEQGKEVTA